MSESMEEQKKESRNTSSPKHEVSHHNSSKTTEGVEMPSSDHDKYPAGTVQVASEKEATQLPEAGKSVLPSNRASDVSLKEGRTVTSVQNRGGRNGRRPPLDKSRNCHQYYRNKERSRSRFRSRSRSRSRSKFSFRSRNLSSTHQVVTSATRRMYRANNYISKDKVQGIGKHFRTQHSNFHSRKVQDLRHIITVREDKQKCKVAQQKNETKSDSCRDKELDNPQVTSVKQPCGANDGAKRINQYIQHDNMTEVANASAQVSPKRAKTLQMRTIEEENLNNESFWNMWINKKMDIDSLLEVEESIEKELDEAQELRRSCEIQELASLKAYRKAQRALAEANARCCHLKSERSMNPEPFQSLLMNSLNLHWHQDAQKNKCGERRDYAADKSKTLFGLPGSTHFEASLKV